jgi:TolA-binding protein
MRRKALQVALLVLLLALPAWATQQNPPPGGSPPSGTTSPAPPPTNPKGGIPPPAAQSDVPALDRSTAAEDMNVGLFYMHKGDQDAAIPRFEDAVRKQPKLVKARFLLAEAYEKKGDKRAAAKCYEEYLQAFPSAQDGKKIQKKIDKLRSE